MPSMKGSSHGNGFRLVQRKFAQGVPIPASSAAPTPPDRKPEPAYAPKNVYHNKMSARSLLDIVSMQGLHTHKIEPLVVLERLRADELPAPGTGLVELGARSDRSARTERGTRTERGPRSKRVAQSARSGVNSGKIGKRVRGLRKRVRVDESMELRSVQREPNSIKGPARKRKKLSSESTDDIPLVYYFSNKPNNQAKVPHHAKQTGITNKSTQTEKRTPTSKRGERETTTVPDKPVLRAGIRAAEDSSFVFKEPSSPVRLSYRLIKKKTAAERKVKRPPPGKDARRSSLRSARAPEPVIARRPRDKVLVVKKTPKPAFRKPGPKPQKDKPTLSSPGTSTAVPRPPRSDSSYCPSEQDSLDSRISELTKRDKPTLSSPGTSTAVPRPPRSDSSYCPSEQDSLDSRISEPKKRDKRTFSSPGTSTAVPRQPLPDSYKPTLSSPGTSTAVPRPPRSDSSYCPSEQDSLDSRISEPKKRDKRTFSSPGTSTAVPRQPLPDSYKPTLSSPGTSTAVPRPPRSDSYKPTFSSPGTSTAVPRQPLLDSSYCPSEQESLDSRISELTKRDEPAATPTPDAGQPGFKSPPPATVSDAESMDYIMRFLAANGIKEERDASASTLVLKGGKLSPASTLVLNGGKLSPASNLSRASTLVLNVGNLSPAPSPALLHNSLQEDLTGRANDRDVSPANSEVSSTYESDIIKLNYPPPQNTSIEPATITAPTIPQDPQPKLNQEARNTVEENTGEEDVAKKRAKGKGIGKKTIPRETMARKPGPKPAAKEVRKTQPQRAAKATHAPTPEEPSIPRYLLNARSPAPPASADVYEFNEPEHTRPPSGLRRRAPPPPAPSPAPPPSPSDTGEEPDDPNTRYIDIFPKSSHFVQIAPRKGFEDRNPCVSVSLVPKAQINRKKKTLIDNSSIFNKFIDCLPAELQNQVHNFIQTEGTSGDGPSQDSSTGAATSTYVDQRAGTSTNLDQRAGTSTYLDQRAGTSTYLDQRAGTSTYLDQRAGTVLEAPVFYPTAEEFQDPITYFEKIAPEASKYGLCKIVPPEGFKPPCHMNDTIRFAVIYQYISKMYSRWGPVSRELAAIKAHLRTQSVVFARPPLLDGSEVNLPKLYHAVERNGGLSNVIQRKRWGRVADELKLTKLQHPERKLDPIYMRYLLPYATLSDQERQCIMAEVERCWTTKYQKMLERARNPFQRQNRMLGTESESDDEAEDGNTAGALHEAEDCIVQGRTINLATFKKIATSLMEAHFEPREQPPSADEVEKAYWRAVLLATDHIVANTASIDTGGEGYGFPKDTQAEYGTHPWNLKVLARNPNNVLRYLGPVLGVTVPTLHLGMLFSTSCWHRDPHGLPWTEYMHSGAQKIWYGIPRDESANFRRAVETLCPAYCQNKAIWLASEITMVPPNILSEHGVKLSRLLQRPGEYVMVFPEAHSCSITTGFGISESVYFASNAWLNDVYKLFQELRNSCEPTMFSLEQLLLNGSADASAPPQVCSVLSTLVSAELEHRSALEQKGIRVALRPNPDVPLHNLYVPRIGDQDECEYCRSTLFLSKVTGLTGRRSAVCPEHALRLLQTKKHKKVALATLEIESAYSTSDLEDMLERLDRGEAAQRLQAE